MLSFCLIGRCCTPCLLVLSVALCSSVFLCIPLHICYAFFHLLFLLRPVINVVPPFLPPSHSPHPIPPHPTPPHPTHPQSTVAAHLSIPPVYLSNTTSTCSTRLPWTLLLTSTTTTTVAGTQTQAQALWVWVWVLAVTETGTAVYDTTSQDWIPHPILTTPTAPPPLPCLA